MQVIRLEHPSSGRGIFWEVHLVCDNSWDTAWYKRHNKMESARHIDGFNSSIHFCAYKSIDELQLWLRPEEIRHIISKGFVVLLLEVNEFILGPNQVLYTKESITEQKDISELFV